MSRSLEIFNYIQGKPDPLLYGIPNLFRDPREIKLFLGYPLTDKRIRILKIYYRLDVGSCAILSLFQWIVFGINFLFYDL